LTDKETPAKHRTAINPLTRVVIIGTGMIAAAHLRAARDAGATVTHSPHGSVSEATATTPPG
jgi:hypothetical protein